MRWNRRGKEIDPWDGKGGRMKEKMGRQEVACVTYCMLIISILFFILLGLPAPLGALRDEHNIDTSVKLGHQVSTLKDLNPHLAGWDMLWLSMF